MEIISVNEETLSVSARDLHDALEVGTDFRHWFPRMTEYGFTEGVDFNSVKNDRVQDEGNRQVTREIVDYQLSIDMAKEICMIQRTEKGKQVRKYFIDLEKAWNTPEQVMARGLKAAQRMLGIAHETMRRRKVRGDWTTAELRILYKKLSWTPEEWVQLFKT